jgi:hypothetical protein
MAKEKKLKPNIYKIISDCVERGIDFGWNRAHKYTDIPDESLIKQEVEKYIMLEICENFKFD